MFDGFDKYIAVFLTGFVVTYLLTPVVRSLAVRFGVVDLPNERRPHKRPTARGGGLAVVLGIYAACVDGAVVPRGDAARRFRSPLVAGLPSRLADLAGRRAGG